MALRARRITAGYVSVLVMSLVVAVAAGWTSLAERMNGEAYDWMFRVQPPPSSVPTSVVLAIDEATLSQAGGMRGLRGALAAGLQAIRGASPRALAIDIILAEDGDSAQDAALEAAFRDTGYLILASDLIPGEQRWEYPIERFRKYAEAIGHIHAAPDPVSRVLPLEHAGGRDRRWAMALEAFRARKNAAVVESPDGIEIGGENIPGRRETARALYIRYRPGIPQLPLASLLADPALADRCRDKVVFVGLTAQTAARDRLMTPFGRMMSGVEIHAQAYETLMDGHFLKPATDLWVVVLSMLFVWAAGAVFALLSGWVAYASGFAIVLLAHATPHIAFGNGLIVPYLTPVFAAWLSVGTAASWQHFVVRRQLRKSESDKARYQQAIQFVTHEMRSPLTAIQGSSELMGRYNLNEDKRRQMAQMINSESKRLARMIQTFLDIERLTDGEMEIRTELLAVDDLVQSCVERARVLAERKQIDLRVKELEPLAVSGDRELMEYAVYNLLTNAVKYSPAETVVDVSVSRDGANLRVSVRDQGIGMDAKELRNIFKKFYRTKKAEASGEVGTGIGLSIVQQIVNHHHGRVEVTSEPQKGSCFTIVLPTASKLVPQ